MIKKSYHCLEFWLKFPAEMNRLSSDAWKDNLGILPKEEKEELEEMVSEVGKKALAEVYILLGRLRKKFQDVIKNFSCTYREGSKEKTIKDNWSVELPFYSSSKQSDSWIMSLGCDLSVSTQKIEFVAWVWRKGSSAQNIQDKLQDIVIDSPEGWSNNKIAVIARTPVVRDTCDNFEWDKAIEEITNRIRHLCEENKLLDRLAKEC